LEDYREKHNRNNHYKDRKAVVKKALDEFDGNEIQGWITEGFVPETVYFTEFFGYQVAEEGLTTSQIRNLYHEVKKIQMSGATDLARLEQERRGENNPTKVKFSAQNSLLMLSPRLSYAAARSNKEGGKLLKRVLIAGLNAVMETDDLEKKIERFNNFSDLFEAVLCYHKTAGGKDSDKN
jgi:CRISPR-associated protein Csm2